MSRWSFIGSLFAVLLVGCSRSGGERSGVHSGAKPVDSMRVLTPPNRVAQIREQHLPNVELTTHLGRKVRFYDDLVKGKVVAINFMYAKCRGACLPATAHLAEVQQALGDRMGREVSFLSISLDPDQDTPNALSEYAKAHDAGPGWYFLTGKHEDIELLRRKLGAYELDPVVDADLTQHAGIVILGNEPKGRWKAISALSNPVRIRQAIERSILPPKQWSTGEAAIAEVPLENDARSSIRVEPADLARFSVAR
jgi:protein SCO1